MVESKQLPEQIQVLVGKQKWEGYSIDPIGSMYDIFAYVGLVTLLSQKQLNNNWIFMAKV